MGTTWNGRGGAALAKLLSSVFAAGTPITAALMI